MNKHLWSVLSAVMVLMLAACGGANEAEPESALPGSGGPLLGGAARNSTPELHYGDEVQIRSVRWDLCLAAKESGSAFPAVTTVPQCQTTERWKIINADDPNSTATVTFNAPVRLYSPHWQGYFVPDWGNNASAWLPPFWTDMKFQDASNLKSTANLTFGAHVVITQMWGCQGCTAFLSTRDPGQPAASRDAEMRFEDAERWALSPGGAPFAYWMTEMSDTLRDIPLTKLAIPGSHDAGTYSIADGAPFSPDLPLDQLPDFKEMLLANATLAPQVNTFMARFARAQSKTITEQLNTGIRYFDLRPGAADNGKGDELLIVHSLYGGNVLNMIDDVARFLAAHPREVVILDISHFTAMSDAHHATLMARIKTAFEGRLVPPPAAPSAADPKANQYTIGDIQGNGWQVVCIYQDDHAAADPKLWRYGTPTSTKWWPNKPTTGEVKAVLEDRLRNDRPLLPEGSFFVLQTVTTPDMAYYSRVFFSLETPEEVMTEIVHAANEKIAGLESAIGSRQGDIAWLDQKIQENRNHIRELQDWIDDHPYFWDYPGRKWREGQIAIANGLISGYEATKSTESSAIGNANTALSDARKKLSDFKQAYLDATTTPGTLVELAEQVNGEMRGWLPGWRSSKLNIVIQDAVSEDFVDAVRRLNK